MNLRWRRQLTTFAERISASLAGQAACVPDILRFVLNAPFWVLGDDGTLGRRTYRRGVADGMQFRFILAGWHNDTSNLLSSIDSAEHFAPFFSGSRSGAGSYDQTPNECGRPFCVLAGRRAECQSGRSVGCLCVVRNYRFEEQQICVKAMVGSN